MSRRLSRPPPRIVNIYVEDGGFRYRVAHLNGRVLIVARCLSSVAETALEIHGPRATFLIGAAGLKPPPRA